MVRLIIKNPETSSFNGWIMYFTDSLRHMFNGCIYVSFKYLFCNKLKNLLLSLKEIQYYTKSTPFKKNIWYFEITRSFTIIFFLSI
jgi:hypothetical protein